MFIRKWSPVYAPAGVGSDTATDDDAAPPIVDDTTDDDGDEQPEPRGLRAELEKNFKEASEDGEPPQKTKAVKEKPEGRPKAIKSRARKEMEELEGTEDADLDVEEPAEQPETPVPKSLSKEAKAEWAKTPKAVQAAYLKREEDSDKGVAALKAQYNELDQVINPRIDMLKQAGQTPAQAINHLFGWFEQLNMDTHRVKNGQAPSALIALAHSLGIDLMGGLQQQQQPAADPKTKETPTQEEIPEAVKGYVGQLEQKIAQLEQAVSGGFQQFGQTFQDQAMKETTHLMNTWAQGKDYFQDVRQQMAYIIGSGMIPPKEDGTADLDKAYDMAVYANPDVREKVLAKRRADALEKRKQAAEKEKAAQQEAANKARTAAVGLKPSAPSPTFGTDKNKKPKSKSVRESLQEAIEEHNRA